MPRPTQRVDAYIRVSAVRGREGEKFISPEIQEKRIKAWVTSQEGYEVTGDGPDGGGCWHELDVSGGSMDRPKLNAIIDRIDAGESDGIVVYSLDRFGRTLIGALTIIERLHAEGKVFASVSDSFDINSDTGRLVLKIMLSLAEFERDRIHTRWRDAKSNAIHKRSVHISATPPFGYRREQLVDTKGNPYLGKLIVEEAERPVVVGMFERRAAGDSWGSIVRWLQSTGVAGSRGNGWNISTVQGIVANSVYLGVARGGMKGTPNNPDAHEPLIDPATWHAAQRHTPARRPSARGTTQPVIGMGFVRCATCRFVVSTRPYKNGKFSADGTGDFDYMCDRPWRGAGCERPATTAAATRMNGAPTIDDVIAEQVIARLKAEPSGFREVDAAGEDLQALEDEWQAAQARADECALDFDMEEQIGHDRWLKRCAALNQLAEEKLQELTDARNRQSTELSLGRTAHAIADDWENGRLTVDEKRTVVASMVQAIFLAKAKDGKKWAGRLKTPEKRDGYMESLRRRVHVVWADEPPVDVPRHDGSRRRGDGPRPAGYQPEPFEFPAR